MNELTVALSLSGINSLALLSFVYHIGKLVNRIENIEVHYSRLRDSADDVIEIKAKMETLETRFASVHATVHQLRNDIMVHLIKTER